MKQLKTTALLVVALLGNGVNCATSGPFQTFGHCTSKALEATGRSLHDDLALAFATDAYEIEVAKLLVKFSKAEVDCAVDLLISQWEALKSVDQAKTGSLVRARAWRAGHQ